MLHLSKRLDNDELAKLQPGVRKSYLPSTALPGVPEELLCQNCGANFLSDFQFCRKCGHPSPAQAALVGVGRLRHDSRKPHLPHAQQHFLVPTIPNAPPRLIARLQELELDSLLALCERLKGPKRAKMVKASEEELDALCEFLSDGKPLTPRQQHHQQQLLYLNHLREARQSVPLSLSPPKKVRQGSPSPTEVPSTVERSSELSPQAPVASPSPQVLDALLLELNELLEKVPAESPKQNPGAPAAGRVSAGAGPLPLEERAVDVVEEDLQAVPSLPSLPSSLTEAVKALESGLKHLQNLFEDEVAQATAELQSENSGLLKQLEELRQRAPARAPVSSTECQTEDEALPAPKYDVVEVEAEDAAVNAARFVQPEPPDCAPPTPTGSMGAFAVCLQWQEVPGQADWGEDAVEFTSSAKDCNSCWKMHEFSRSRMAWDLLGLLFLLYDAVITPWQLAFGELSSAEVMAWCLPVYWSATIILTACFTTFSMRGVLQSRKKAMLWRYVTQGFFVIDVLATCADILVLCGRYNLQSNVLSFLQNKDVLLGIQAVRLLRILRLNRNLLGVRARVRSEAYRAFGKLVLCCLLVLIGAHILACGLYYLGSANGGNAATWLEDYAQTQQQEDNLSMYLAALLWALSQITPGTGPTPVNPRSHQDLVFSGVAHVLALVACVTLMLQVTGVVLRLRDAQGDWTRRHMMCRAHLDGGAVARPMRHHIWSWLETEPEPRAQVGTGLKDQWCASPLHILPQALQQELKCHLGVPLLTLHPFFHELDVAHPQAIKEVVKCLQQRFYSPAQEIFGASEIATSMSVMAKGLAIYSALKRPRAAVKVAAGRHVSEAGLWLDGWAHRGTLVAGEAVGEVLELESRSFGVLLRSGPCELWQAASSYARAFARRSIDLDLSDLDQDTEALMKITYDAFEDALAYLKQEAGRDGPAGRLYAASPLKQDICWHSLA